jgi:hypothetical protein
MIHNPLKGKVMLMPIVLLILSILLALTSFLYGHSAGYQDKVMDLDEMPPPIPGTRYYQNLKTHV